MASWGRHLSGTLEELALVAAVDSARGLMVRPLSPNLRRARNELFVFNQGKRRHRLDLNAFAFGQLLGLRFKV